MAKYGVVRTDNMSGTDVRADLVSVKYMGADGGTATAIENGHVVKLDGLMDGEREIYKGKDVAASDDIQDVVLIASPEVMYDERKRNLDEFINEADMPSRGYHLHEHSMFSVTKECLEGESDPKKGNVVELMAGTKLNVATAATQGSTVVGYIDDVEDTGRYKYYSIKISHKAPAAGDV